MMKKLRLDRIGGWTATVVSLLLLVVVLVRDVGLNVVNGWTIGLGLAGGILAIRASGPRDRIGACALVVLAMVPALIGGLGLLYVPSLVLIPLGRSQSPRRPARGVL